MVFGLEKRANANTYRPVKFNTERNTNELVSPILNKKMSKDIMRASKTSDTILNEFNLIMIDWF